MKRTLRRVKPARRTFAMVIGDGLLLALALVGLFLFQFNVYGLPGSRLVVLRACLLAAVLFLAVFSLPKYRWAVVLVLIILGLALLWQFWNIVFQGAQAVYSTAAHVITESTDFPGEFPIPQTWTQEEIRTASNCFLTAIIFALALPLGWAVVRCRSFFPVLLLTLPWLIPIFLAEFPPDVVSLSMLAASWITLLLTGLTAKKDPEGGARLTLAVLPAALLVLCCICLIFPVEGYAYPDWASATARRLTEVGQNIQTKLGSGGAPATVDLAHSGPQRYTGRSVLRVKSDWTGRVYLRGAAYANYTGDRWENLSDEALTELETQIWDNSLVLPVEDRREEQAYSATITHLNSSTRMAYCLYQPVNLLETLDGVSYVADSYLRLEEPEKEYAVEFTDPDPNSRSYTVNDEAYSEFVHKYYRDVPEELADVLASWWENEALQTMHGIRTNGPYQIAIAQMYANILEATTEYDLQTPRTPAGEDFVAYFLTESHRGYCVHYASTVAMLLRMTGIPARYVSGYTAEITDGEALVLDSAAHAWVEVYVDGSGWYPVEVTPAAAFGGEAVGAESPAVSNSSVESTPPVTSSLTPMPSKSPVEEPAEEADETDKKEPGAAGQESIAFIWLCYMAAALVIVGLPVLVRTLRRRRWNRLTALPDHNQAVIEVYGWYQKLFSWGGKPDRQMEALARKAKFSQHTLTAEERQEALNILRQEITRLSAKPSWKRPVFRYLFVWK